MGLRCGSRLVTATLVRAFDIQFAASFDLKTYDLSHKVRNFLSKKKDE